MPNQHSALGTNQAQALPLILVVEADEANAEMLSLVLSQELPCLVTCVSTGREALHIVEKITPDLLVSWCSIPSCETCQDSTSPTRSG